MQPSSPPKTRINDQRAGLAGLSKDAQEILYTISSVFPFKFFADRIIIRKHHLDVIRGVFFGSGTATRVQIHDIRQVQLQYNPFFATMEITPQGPLEDIVRVTALWKNQAQRAKRIIAGLYECHQLKVDLSQYTRGELLGHLEEIGKTRV